LTPEGRCGGHCRFRNAESVSPIQVHEAVVQSLQQNPIDDHFDMGIGKSELGSHHRSRTHNRVHAVDNRIDIELTNPNRHADFTRAGSEGVLTALSWAIAGFVLIGD
jgi:hypothetical protein